MQSEKIEKLEIRVTDLEAEIERIDLQYILLREEFWNLKQELSGEIDLTNDNVTNLESKVAKLQKSSVRSGGGAGGAAVGQTSILKLTSQLAGQDVDTPEITRDDIFNNTSTFQNTFNDLLTQINTGTSVNQEQIDALRDGLNTDFTSLLDNRLGKLRDSVENVEEVFSTINQVASEVVEFRETASQLREEKAALAEEIDEAIAEAVELKEQEKQENTTIADIREDAFDTASEVIARDNQ